MNQFPQSALPPVSHTWYRTSRATWLALILAAILAMLALPLTVATGAFEPLPLALAIVAAGGLAIMLRPTWSLYVLLLIWPVYPTMLRVFGLESSTLVKLYPEAIMSAALLGLVAGWLLQRRRLTLQVRAPDLAVALLFLGACFSALLSPSAEALLYGFRVTYTPILFYVLARLLPLTPSEVRRWLWLFLGVAVVLALVGIYFQVTNPGRWYAQLLERELLVGLQRKGSWRMSSLLLNPLYFGPVMAIAALVSFSFLLTWRRWYWFALFALFSICMYYSQTRGSYIMLAVGVVVILFMRSRHNYPMWILLLILAFLALAGVAFVFLRGSQFGFLLDSSGSFMASRYGEFSESVQAFLQHPLGFGLGVGHAQRKIAAGAPTAMEVYDAWYFKVLLEGGLFALLLFGIFLTITLVYLARKVGSSRSQFAFTFHVAYLAILAGGAVQALVTNLWEHHMVNGVLWVLLALCTTLDVDGHTTPLIHEQSPDVVPAPSGYQH